MYSIIIPTFSRSDELTELLGSLVKQEYKDFEVIIGDGSPDDSVKKVVDDFQNKLSLKYIYEKGLGISDARNRGVQQAMGDFVIFFDSDCVIPPQYLSEVNNYLIGDPVDAFGGPDKADESFDYRQKAISYAMTSFYTTGGIRGRKKHMGQYQPRSFNMGIKRSVFNELGGFSGLKVSEDIDLSLRLLKAGYRSELIEEAYVYHKRRSTFYKFFRQVFSFGSGRIDLQLRHGDALKPVHTLPSLFVIYLLAGLMISLFSNWFFLIWVASLLAYMAGILVDSTYQNKNLIVGFISVYAAFVMLIGYGLGMIKAAMARMVLGSRKESEKPEITKEA